MVLGVLDSHLHWVDAALSNGPSQRTRQQPLADAQRILVVHQQLDLWDGGGGGVRGGRGQASGPLRPRGRTLPAHRP